MVLGLPDTQTAIRVAVAVAVDVAWRLGAAENSQVALESHEESHLSG